MAYTNPGETRARIYEFLRERLLAGSPPTVREVQAAFGFRSVESARAQLEVLVRDGVLTKTRGKARSYRLAAQGRPVRTPRLVPLLGRVQAGPLQAAIQEAEGFVAVDARPHDGELFALRVRGESMTGAGILPGDMVIVDRARTPQSGDIVIAEVDGQWTMKYLKKRGEAVALIAANPNYQPVRPKRELKIAGVVTAVVRKYR